MSVAPDRALSAPASLAVDTRRKLPLPELEALVAERRRVYLGHLSEAPEATGNLGMYQNPDGEMTLGALVWLQCTALHVETAKLAYEEALEQLRSARADRAQASMLAATVAMTLATVVVAAATVVLAAHG